MAITDGRTSDWTRQDYSRYAWKEVYRQELFSTPAALRAGICIIKTFKALFSRTKKQKKLFKIPITSNLTTNACSIKYRRKQKLIA